MTPNDFRILPIVLDALQKPREPRSILNYMCACDTANPESREGLNNEDIVSPLLPIWFASGSELDDLCQPFAVVIRELKANPRTLVGNNWDSLDGKVAKVLLADQLSRSCFRGSAEAFSYDLIGRQLVHDLLSPESLKETLTLPAALLYLLPWALAHSEELKDLERACEIIDITISEHPRFSLFERSKMAVNQHRQVLEKFGRYPQRNKDFLRENTMEETEWLNDKENLPIWAGGKLSFDKPIT